MQLKIPFQFSGEQEVVGQHHSSKLSPKAGPKAGESLRPMYTRIPIKVKSYKGDDLALG